MSKQDRLAEIKARDDRREAMPDRYGPHSIHPQYWDDIHWLIAELEQAQAQARHYDEHLVKPIVQERDAALAEVNSLKRFIRNLA